MVVVSSVACVRSRDDVVLCGGRSAARVVADHGVIVASVPWARRRARFTKPFEDQVTRLAVHTSKSAVAQLMRVSWRTVGGICDRVAREQGGRVDLLAGLIRIGIDEVSYRKRQRYLTVVVDHDSGRLVWAAPNRGRWFVG
jgi:transposase